jgi:lipopolysaccharide transport system ATP-binding protein
MTAVSNLCHNAILLDKGIIVGRGTVNEVINLYFKNNSTQRLNINSSDFSFEDNGFKFIDFKMQPRTMNDYIDVNTFIDISFEFELSRDINLFNLSTHLFNQLGDLVFNIFSNPAPIIAGKYKAQYTIPANLLNDGSYIIDMMVVEDASKAIFHLKEGLVFEIQDKRDVEIWHSKWRGQIRPTSIKIEIENKI